MSRKMRELLSSLRAKQEAAQSLQSKEGVTEQELKDALSEINTIKAQIEMQKAIDDGKTFDSNGQEITGDPAADGETKAKQDVTDTLAYRQAFMDYVKKGTRSEVLQFRSADASTASTDVGAIIPSTILQEVIKKVQSYGQVFALVRKLAVKGGVNVPILAVKPVATWIGENTSGDKQKVDMSQKVSFTYYGLECKIAVSILADTVTITQFESILIELIAEAMTKALDIAIVSGDGTAGPLGITKDTRIPVAHVVTLNPTDFGSWSAWKKKVFAKMPLAYKGGAVFLMASGTFEGYIDGMTDNNGQPIGRVNYGITNGPQESFGGKTVVEVEDDVIANYDDAATGDVVGIYGNLQNYAINSNMQLTMFRYLDHVTNEYVDKALLVADGKTLDPNGFVIIKKGAAA